jgi:hypothetical protein
VHKTTKKYLNLGNFTNIDFFLKEKITESNRSVMKTNKHVYVGPDQNYLPIANIF